MSCLWNSQTPSWEDLTTITIFITATIRCICQGLIKKHKWYSDKEKLHRSFCCFIVCFVTKENLGNVLMTHLRLTTTGRYYRLKADGQGRISSYWGDDKCLKEGVKSKQKLEECMSISTWHCWHRTTKIHSLREENFILVYGLWGFYPWSLGSVDCGPRHTEEEHHGRSTCWGMGGDSKGLGAKTTTTTKNIFGDTCPMIYLLQPDLST